MLSARATLQAAYEKLHKAVLAFVREDAKGNQTLGCAFSATTPSAA
jgi:hypothetical protein